MQGGVVSRLKIRAPQDLGAAVVFFAIGLVGLYLGAKLGGMRAGAQLGSGSMPRALCWICLAFGAFMLIRSLLTDGPPIARVPWRAVVVVTAAIVVFGVLIERFGYVPAAIVAPLLASFALKGSRWRESLVFAVLLAGGATLLFITLLGQPLRYIGGV
jgi:putative tricarboxylic transport membrane protein